MGLDLFIVAGTIGLLVTLPACVAAVFAGSRTTMSPRRANEDDEKRRRPPGKRQRVAPPARR